MLCILLSILSCRREPDYVKPTCNSIHYPLEAQYKDWLSLPLNDYGSGSTACRSSDSLFDVFFYRPYTSKYRNGTYGTEACDTMPDGYCTSTYESRLISYRREVDQWEMDIYLHQNHNIPCLRIGPRGSDYYLDIRLSDTIGLRTKLGNCGQLSYAPKIQILPTDTTYGHVFHDVFRITDTYIEASGTNKDILWYDVSPQRGIIRWKQKDGITWEVDIEP